MNSKVTLKHASLELKVNFANANVLGKLLIYLVSENLQATDVILERGTSEGTLFPEHLDLDEQLLFLLRGLSQLIGQPRVLRGELRDESRLIPFRSSGSFILLLQLTPQRFHVRLKLQRSRLVLAPRFL